ncbi:MAG TPA: hypothetical protein VFV34_24660, partial [Blastocatellia bacterium]|nr:hypothetical protein [Blastocatellia bacterium]
MADPSGMAKPGARALPDGEIAVQLNDGSWAAGTPIPAIVPMPTLPMAPLPAKVKIVPATFSTTNPTPQSLKIDGTVTGGLAWALNGSNLPNNSTIKINPGDTITFGVQSGTHGITFLDKAQAEAVFSFGAGVPFQPQPNIIPNTPNAWGTPGQTAGTTLATLTVKNNTGGVTDVPFICTIHKTAMAGTFQIGASGVVTVGFKAEVNDADLNAGKNPGFPFFVPGVAGQRVVHPPLDFAREEDEKGNPKLDSSGNPIYLDGGLPRSVAILDVGTYEKHNRWDFSKDNGKLTAYEVPEEGTKEEKVAMAAHAKRAHPSFTPEGLPGSFILNGLPPVSGAPFANPGIDLQGNPVADTRRYKAVNIELDLVLNKKGWHFPQGRMLTLWGDAQATVENKKPPEPFFFRANSGEVIEYWHSNLVPNYYELDDFQVRTPTDILGQHIHLVKFDVTSSDGAGNGFNYEDGTFSSQEVREQIEHINSAGGLWSFDFKTQKKLTPKSIKELCGGDILMKECVGAQATIQRWYADPQLNNTGYDKTMRTVFTHDHFGPSTHQQAGLYAGLLVEPSGSQWTTQSGDPLGTRSDGGPTTWAANILTKDPADSYREFMLEFQDDQLAYKADSWSTPRPYVKYASPDPPGLPWGWADPTHAIAPQTNTGLVITGTQTAVPPPPDPVLVTNAAGTGTYSVNYRNEPLAFRVGAPPNTPATPEQTDLSSVFRSIERADKELNRQPAQGTQIDPLCTGPSCFKFPAPMPGAQSTDPYTPFLRAYEGDKVQIRMLVGAHQFPHAFNLQGLKWLFEPDDPNSGYRATQGTGISEHYEMLFNLPRTGVPYQTDYQYATSSDTTGLQNGNWGLLRAYTTPQSGLKLLPNNTYVGSGPPTTGCAPYSRKQPYAVTVTTAAKALGGPLVYNSRGAVGTPGQNQLAATNALIYVRSEDLDASGRLKPGVPVEPLILRAAAGDCVEVSLT